MSDTDTAREHLRAALMAYLGRELADDLAGLPRTVADLRPVRPDAWIPPGLSEWTENLIADLFYVCRELDPGWTLDRHQTAAGHALEMVRDELDDLEPPPS